jgi:hypothetical protein
MHGRRATALRHYTILAVLITAVVIAAVAALSAR